MAMNHEDRKKESKSAGSKAEFLRLAGIGPELAEFVTELITKPESFFSIPDKRRREFEHQMDAILSSIEE